MWEINLFPILEFEEYLIKASKNNLLSVIGTDNLEYNEKNIDKIIKLHYKVFNFLNGLGDIQQNSIKKSVKKINHTIQNSDIQLETMPILENVGNSLYLQLSNKEFEIFKKVIENGRCLRFSFKLRSSCQDTSTRKKYFAEVMSEICPNDILFYHNYAYSYKKSGYKIASIICAFSWSTGFFTFSLMKCISGSWPWISLLGGFAGSIAMVFIGGYLGGIILGSLPGFIAGSLIDYKINRRRDQRLTSSFKIMVPEEYLKDISPSKICKSGSLDKDYAENVVKNRLRLKSLIDSKNRYDYKDKSDFYTALHLRFKLKTALKERDNEKATVIKRYLKTKSDNEKIDYKYIDKRLTRKRYNPEILPSISLNKIGVLRDL